MTTEPAVLARNTSYFTLALVAQKVISFLYFTFLARLLGPEQIGQYVFALSLTTIFSVLLDLGLANVLIKEVARQPKSAERYVRLVIGFKLVAMLLVVGLVVLFVWLSGQDLISRHLVYLAVMVMVLDSFTLTAYSTIRGFHNLIWESVGTILMQMTLALGGLLVSQFTRDLRWFMAALVAAALINCLYSLWQLRWRYGVRLGPVFDMIDYRFLLKLAGPFALAAALTRFYGYVDSVLLSLLSTDWAVGIYSVAYKITFAWQFIPAAFSASLFPGFSAYFKSAPEKLATTFMWVIIYLSALAIPISFGIIILAPEIIKLIYPAFSESVLPLQILIFSLIFLFLTFPVGALLPACDRQWRQTGNLALAALSNLIINLALIPLWGPVGAAIASLCSTVILLLSGWLVVVKLVKLDGWFLCQRLSKIVLSGLVMLLAVWWFKQQLNFLLVIPLAGLIYIALVLVIGGVTWQEMRNLWLIISKRRLSF